MRRTLTAVAVTALLALTGCGSASEAASPGDSFTLRIGSIGNANKLSGPVGYLDSKGGLVPAWPRRTGTS